MKKSSQSQVGSSRRKGIAPVSFIGIVGIIVSIILAMIVLLLPTGSPSNSTANVVFVGEFNNFPEKSMKNAINAVGFDMEVEKGELDIKDHTIIVAVGPSSFEYVAEYKDNPLVLGFVLVCPEFPDGSKVNGMNAQNPSKDIAIFAGADDSTDVTSIKDARLIYERLSGDDTVYGTPIKRGGLFASKCYVNNSQNRWLSLSSFKVSSGKSLLFSPLFQNELAGYISTSYGTNTKASYGRINAYYVLAIISIMCAFVFFSLYLAATPVRLDGVRPGKWNWVAFCVAAFLIAFIIAGGASIPRVKKLVGGLVPLEAVVVNIAAAVVVVIAFIFGKDVQEEGDKPSRREDKMTRTIKNLVITVAPIILFTEYAFILCDMGSTKVALIIVFSLIDVVAYGLLSISQYKYVLIMGAVSMASTFVMLLAGSVLKNPGITYGAIVSLISVPVAGIVSFPATRHSNNPLFAGITHGFAMLLLMFALL